MLRDWSCRHQHIWFYRRGQLCMRHMLLWPSSDRRKLKFVLQFHRLLCFWHFAFSPTRLHCSQPINTSYINQYKLQRINILYDINSIKASVRRVSRSVTRTSSLGGKMKNANTPALYFVGTLQIAISYTRIERRDHKGKNKFLWIIKGKKELSVDDSGDYLCMFRMAT